MVLFGGLAAYTTDRWYLVHGRVGIFFSLVGRQKFTYDTIVCASVLHFFVATTRGDG